MRQDNADFGDGRPPVFNNHPQPIRDDIPPISQMRRPGPGAPPAASTASPGQERPNMPFRRYGPISTPTHQLNEALRESVRSRPRVEQLEDMGNWSNSAPHIAYAAPSHRTHHTDHAHNGAKMDVDFEALSEDGVDRPTNIYYIAQYLYQISINALTMADNELAVLLPNSGRVMFNARLFSDVPRNRELVTRDAWWRVVDASPAVRFLLGWCVSVYHTSHFQGVDRSQLPGWRRKLYFGPTTPNMSRELIQFRSDVVCDVTKLFAPAGRLWQQIQEVVPGIRAEDHQWRSRLQSNRQSVAGMLSYLAEQNNCPITLIQRSLDGNQRLTSLDDYVGFTEAIMRDIPRLQIQRTIAIRNVTQGNLRSANSPKDRVEGRFSPASQQQFSGMSDPRQRPTFWQLYL